MDSNNDELRIKEIKDPRRADPAKVDKNELKKLKNKKNKSAVHEVFDWVEIIALSLAFVLLMFSYVARQARVDGSSMRETFHHGESIIISNLFYKPKQGDIVVFQVPNSRLTT